MRLFVALDIDDAIRERIARFMDGVREFAADARWVRPESLHITLKFIGERSAEQTEAIKDSLVKVLAKPTEVNFRGTGFFPTPKSARVFWVGIEADEHLARLADSVNQQLSSLRLPKDDHPFSPHLTLARGKSAAPGPRPGDQGNRKFQRLQEKLALLTAPDFGTMTAREFFLYESKLSPSGSRYTKLQNYPLS